MICPHCGRDTPVGEKHCTSCGGALDPARLPDTDADATRAADLAAHPDFPNTPTIGSGGVTTSRSAPTTDGAATTRHVGMDDPTAVLPSGKASRGMAAPLTVGEKFGTRYRIIRLLGMGGMGAVYQAWDSELEVVVAIKVIRPHVMSDPLEARGIERRFKQELLLARQVTHRNVVRIHDLGEIGGIKYITMSYVEGEDLATMLRKAGNLPVPAALRIVRQIAAGLQAAHEAGVVHRDLKPANIMIEGDRALIMDFGIARSTSGAGPARVSDLAAGTARRGPLAPQATIAGAIVGTVAYMAPEQARGGAVDHRADIYALGLITSDLLLGTGARGQTTLEELRDPAKGPRPPLRSVDPRIPEALDGIVQRCTALDPAERFQTTAELVAALDRLDERGTLLPLVRRLTRGMVAAAVALVVALLAGTYYVTRRAVETPVQPDPVSVLIADLQNNSSDPVFDRTLEPMLKRALEGASFISAFDREAIRRQLGMPPPERLDEGAARKIAVQQGLGVVLSGSIDRRGNGYGVSFKAVQTVTGDVITAVDARASTRDEVLATATELVSAVRQALGDEAPESAQFFAMASLSAASLDVVRHWAAGREAASNNRFEDARRSYMEAVKLDPQFAMGYQGLANVSLNLGNPQDAQKYIKEALRYLEGMTERERYAVRAGFYALTGDFPQCAKEYSELIAAYPADVAAHNNLAYCLVNLRRFPEALDEMRRVIAIVPRRALYRVNLALYSVYATEFQAGEQEARGIQEPDVKAVLAVAFAQLGQGQLAQAMATYDKLATINALGVSLAASGFADLAVLEGRFSDAARILAQGAAEDLSAKNAPGAALKFAALGSTQLLRGQRRAAMAALDQALTHSNAVGVRFLAARSLVEAGEMGRARPLIEGLANELQPEPQAYAKIVEAEIALENKDPRQAIKILNEANALLDTWIGHFTLGRAYWEAGALAQADSEFDRCLKRRGEALQLFLGDEVTYSYIPQVYYFQGRVREGLQTAGFAESYRAYLAMRGQSKEDPLVPEVRQRAGR